MARHYWHARAVWVPRETRILRWQGRTGPRPGRFGVLERVPRETRVLLVL